MWKVLGFQAHKSSCLHAWEEGAVNQGFYVCDEENQPSIELNINAFSVAQRDEITDALVVIFVLFSQILSKFWYSVMVPC